MNRSRMGYNQGDMAAMAATRTVYPHITLSLAQIHAALAYYYDNADEIEASFAESEKWEAEYERERAEHLRRRQSV